MSNLGIMSRLAHVASMAFVLLAALVRGDEVRSFTTSTKTGSQVVQLSVSTEGDASQIFIPHADSPHWPPPPAEEFHQMPPDELPIGSRMVADTAATTTVKGVLRYRHGDGTLHGAYGTSVKVWDDDTSSADDLMGTGIVDDDGSFGVTFDNADPEGGTADVYLEFVTTNSGVNVHSSGGATSVFSNKTTVLFPNIGAGSFDVGDFVIDLGRPEAADGDERAFQIQDTLSRAWAYSDHDRGYTPHFTFTQWQDGSVVVTSYNRTENRIYLRELDFNSPDVLMRLYGTSVLDSLYGDVNTDWPPASDGGWSFTGHFTPALAWVQGWSLWYSAAAQGFDQFYDDNNPANLMHVDVDANWDGFGAANGNSDNQSVGAGRTGHDTPSAVAAFLLDLSDSRNDATDLYDWTSLGADEIFDVARNYTVGGHHAYSAQDFFNGWYARGWEYHPQLNGQMQVHGMHQGLSRPTIGLFTGVDVSTGTWYYGGHGSGSYEVKNYGSQPYDLNQLYVWLRGPAGQDIGQFGGDGDGTPVPARTTRNIFKTAEQTGYKPDAPNFAYGTYSVTAGHYRSDNVWQLLEPAESGTQQLVSVTVVKDTDGPDHCTVVDDGECAANATSIHIVANADDVDSSIRSYWTRVGTVAGAGNEQDWVEHAANNATTFDFTIEGLSMDSNVLYYVTVVARNIEGYDTFAYSDGIIGRDATAPGVVNVTVDSCTTSLTELHLNATSSEPDGCISGYWTRVGTTSGAGNEQDWLFVDTGDVEVFDHTINGLSMTAGTTYRVTIVARNRSGFDTFGYSGPVFVTDAAHRALGDLDVDCDADNADFASLRQCLTGPGGNAVPICDAADIDRDGDVDLADAAIFSSCFSGQGAPTACLE